MTEERNNASVLCNPLTVKAIILTRRIYNDFLKLTGLRVPKLTILTHSQRSIATVLYRFLYNDFYFNDRVLLVNSLELAPRCTGIWFLQYVFHRTHFHGNPTITHNVVRRNRGCLHNASSMPAAEQNGRAVTTSTIHACDAAPLLCMS